MLKFIKLLVFIIFFSSAAFATYSIAPVKLIVTPDNKVTSLEFRNDNNENKKFQVTVLEVIKQGNKEIFKETKEIVAAPLMFALPSGGTQTIRVESKSGNELNGRDFKLSIKELDIRKSKKSLNVIHVIPEFRIPVVSKDMKDEHVSE